MNDKALAREELERAQLFARKLLAVAMAEQPDMTRAIEAGLSSFLGMALTHFGPEKLRAYIQGLWDTFLADSTDQQEKLS